jgi:hypothetical protein
MMIREWAVAPTLPMSQEHQELSGETTFWLVGVNLDVLSGYTVWGGDDPDRFLTVDDRLVLAPSVPALLAGLPPTGRHPFPGDGRFARFCERIREVNLWDAAGDTAIGRYDFGAMLTAVREREVLSAPHSGMALDCLGAAVDLGRQYGEDSPGYQLARSRALDTLYRVLWDDEPEDQLDYAECEAAFTHLIDWIEGLTAERPLGQFS